MYITLDNEKFGKKDMAFDMSQPAKFSQVKEPSAEDKRKTSPSIRDYTGSTGLKRMGTDFSSNITKNNWWGSIPHQFLIP